MKIRNSLKSLKDRHRDNRVIRRRGRTYVINKTNRRFKARQADCPAGAPCSARILVSVTPSDASGGAFACLEVA